ncbi:phasin [Polycladidibacter stylochi]|uniref:phasin n=1 Tax=Polycladidibacter stylochi TaxID=1807766 RepID=UPI000830A05D|nr:phasin [Pseudovibrio stylochi]
MATTVAETSKTESKSRSTKAKETAVPEGVFSMSNFEMPEAFREMNEKGMQQAKDAYSKFKSASDELTTALEETVETTRTGVVSYNLKAVEAAKENVDAAFAHITSMLNVKSLSEAVELQSAFARKQYDMLSEQSKEFQGAARDLAENMGKPAKEAFEKATKDFKVS